MFRFFRTVRRRLLDSGSAQKYFVYALGEIFLVVIGILIALQINNWNEARHLKRQETTLLQEMSKNLKKDLVFLEKDLIQIQQRTDKVEALLDFLNTGSFAYHDSLHTYFGATYGMELAKLNVANYEDLKSRGFDLVLQDSLRFQINQFFEEVIFKLDTYLGAELSVNDVLKPFYLKHFQDIQFTQFARPIDPEFILKDIQYKNLVQYRLINLQANQLTDHPRIIQGMKDLIRNIDDYIEK